MDFPEGIRPSGGIGMAGSTADIVLLNPSRGFPQVDIEAIAYFNNQSTFSEDIGGPTKSNQSDANIGSIMRDPRIVVNFDEDRFFSEIEDYERMPCMEPISEYKIFIKITKVETPSPDDPTEFEGF
jgi:hypothetical protein